MNLKILYKPTSELKEYENNPRINDKAVNAVAESIKEYGFNVPILLDKTNTIISGHTRKKAAEAINIESVPCIYIDSLTKEQIREFRLIDNKTNELAEWDCEKLMEELSEIANSNMAEIFDFPDFSTFDIEVKDEDFLQNTEIVKNKERKKVKCPECGEEFEI